MKISQRLAFFVILVVVFTTVAVYISFQLIVMPGVDSVEIQDVFDNVNLTSLAMSEWSDDAQRIVLDWGMWNDMYYYSRGQNPTFVEENVNYDAILNLGINSMAVINDTNEIMFIMSYNSTGAERNFSLEERENLCKGVKYLGERDYYSGLTVQNGTLMLVTMQRIYSGDQNNRTESFFIIGQDIDEQKITRLSEHINRPVQIKLGNISQYPEYGSYTNLTEDILIRSDRDSIDVVKQLHGNYDLPVAVMDFSMDKDKSKMILSTFIIFIISCLIAISIIGIIMFVFMKYTIVDKIKYVEASMNKMISDQNLDTQLFEMGDEDIQELIRIFNHLILKINENKHLLTQNNIELEHANLQLTKLDEMKDLLISNVSHEIRTPLTSISSYVQLLLDGSFDNNPRKRKEALETIHISIKQLDSMVSDILDAAKFSQGKLTMNKTEFVYHDTIRKILDEYKPILKDNSKVTVHDRKGLKIIADENRIKQVLRNLISNSIKYRSKKKLLLNIAVWEKNGRVFTSITDNGIGIAKEHMRFLFSKFYQEDSSESKKTTGTGLGLSIVKHIIKAHDGTIMVRSVKEKGTTFTFSIPIK